MKMPRMSTAVFLLSALPAAIVALVVIGCEKSGDSSGGSVPNSSVPTPYSSTKQTAMTLPTTKSVADLALSMLIPMPASGPSSMPAVIETTRPASTRPDPTTQPVSAIQRMIELVREQDYGDLRDMLFEPLSTIELRQRFAGTVAAFERGAVASVAAAHQSGNAAIVFVRTRGKTPEDNDVSFFYLLRRYDRWKIIVDEPNVKRLTEREKQDLLEAAAWGQERMHRAATRRAASGPAPR